jgi:DNA-directed RNA polymerase specialized sigma24 family protein
MSDDAVTQWLEGLRDGDAEAAQKLWTRYFGQLVRLAGNRLPVHARRDFDEEDVALSALRSFFAAAQEQRFPRLEDRNDLWALLVVITRRKAVAYVRHGTRLKRGGGDVVGESALAPSDGDEARLDALIAEEPTPAFAAEVAEQCRWLLDQLGDDALRTIATLKMQGHTVEEIAGKTDTTRRTVERRPQIIRGKWAALNETEPEGGPR